MSPARTSGEWLAYFEHNAAALAAIPWSHGAELSGPERAALARSIQGFQAGESSEGLHLFRSAERHAARTADPDYVAVTRLFIKEEQRHARDLARFLELNGIPTLKTTFPDRVFRRLRHLVGSLEISIAVLITAEIIALVYYAALQAATRSTILVSLCGQILRDERRHVEFQSEQLGHFRAGRGRLPLAATHGLQRVLFFGTCLVVWAFHRRAFRLGGYSFGRYWRDCWSEFEGAFAHAAATRTLPVRARP